jgi:hypothetical protein
MNDNEKIQHDDFTALLRDVLETNHAIVKQNALIVQALTMPRLLVKADPVYSPWDKL